MRNGAQQDVGDLVESILVERYERERLDEGVVWNSVKAAAKGAWHGFRKGLRGLQYDQNLNDLYNQFNNVGGVRRGDSGNRGGRKANGGDRVKVYDDIEDFYRALKRVREKIRSAEVKDDDTGKAVGFKVFLKDDETELSFSPKYEGYDEDAGKVCFIEGCF